MFSLQGLSGLLKGRPNMKWLPRDTERLGMCLAYCNPLASSQGMSQSVEPQASTFKSDMDGAGSNGYNSFSSMESICGVDSYTHPSCESVPEDGAVVGEGYESAHIIRSRGAHLERISAHGIYAVDVSPPSAISSVKTISTRTSAASHRRRHMARAQRSGWCGLGIPFPLACAYGDEWLHGREDDEVIHKRTSVEIVVEIGNNVQNIRDVGSWLEGTVEMVGAAENAIPETGTNKPRDKKRWVLCGSVGLSGDCGSEGENHSSQNVNAGKRMVSSRRKNQKKSKCVRGSHRFNDCGCWTMCVTPQA